MKYSMFYQSPGGNTKLLADTFEAYLKEAGAEKVEKAEDADLVFVGFWTEQGDANKGVREYMRTLRDRKVFLFGTAGFGDSQTYFDGILEKAEDSLTDSNEIVGRFMCQGKMPEAFRDKYEADKKEIAYQGPHYDLMITNFDKALSHPDETDLENAKKAAAAAAAKFI
ncbi:MAG: flavodoxin family protein [Lachnospiraceae bacterium]|nr:flavodoxin family protein [Lachnospiraceae bacterium]